MKVPEPRKLSSGKWFIQLRLGGESIPVSGWDKAACIREARAVKAEYLAGRRTPAEPETPPAPTLTQAIDSYIAERSNTLSPATIRGYRAIQNNRFKTTMPRRLDQIDGSEWQIIVNAEAATCSPKTLKNALAFVSGVVSAATGKHIPDVTLPGAVAADTAFLTPDEIRIFVAAVKDTRFAVPALLALSSLRISEITALRWENIPKKPEFIRVAGAVVLNEDHHLQEKRQNKNATSSRNVPILIPELAAALERDRKPEGRVLDMKQNTLRLGIHRICKEAGITDVTVHGLRHSFASLAYHLRIPERIAMEIGGWANMATMHKIYTHIARADISRYQTELAKFYKGEDNANKNANKKRNP